VAQVEAVVAETNFEPEVILPKYGDLVDFK